MKTKDVLTNKVTIASAIGSAVVAGAAILIYRYRNGATD